MAARPAAGALVVDRMGEGQLLFIAPPGTAIEPDAEFPSKPP